MELEDDASVHASDRQMDKVMTESFRVIVADPPWPFKDKLPGRTRGAARHYSCMSVEDICRFPLPLLADDAVLLLWRVAAMQQEALDVIRMWGFKPVKTEIVWLKKSVNGSRWFGMGHILRAEHEICLVGTRGHPQVLNHSTRTTFMTDFTGLSAAVGRHSEKPERFYTIIESLFAGPYAELFARRQRPGWTCLGLEV
jgi:N6-adenosine-specific RNA methylase IME4